MKVEVSIGEAIDKLSILELKFKKINNPDKKIEIQKEINELNECSKYKKEYEFYYKLLIYVNEMIWDMTDKIKSMTIENNEFSHISNKIFEFNQKRFRIKNLFNLFINSNIKEQKSYATTSCKIVIDTEEIFYNKISEINFLLLEYDILFIQSSFNDKIKNIFNAPTIYYDPNYINDCTAIVVLHNFSIPDNLKKIFEFEPIKYISGGLLGDFIHQLSVINETFLKTGKKGILYIADNCGGENFRFGAEKAYADTYDIISSQNYIHSYNIYNNETYDINLSNWRRSHLLYHTNWHEIFKNTYNVEWGAHQWLNLPKDSKWNDKVIINASLSRPIVNIDFQKVYSKYKDSLLFVGFDMNEYIGFKNRTNINIECYSPSSLYELCIIINSCKLFIGGLSAPLAFSYALNGKYVLGTTIVNHGDNIHVIGIEKYIKNNISIETLI